MEIGRFYFVSDNYFKVAQDDANLLKNKSNSKRPYLCVCRDTENEDFYWMIPFSSKIDKYRDVYNHKIERHGKCDTISFASVLGEEKAFLIQNICPVPGKFIVTEYTDMFGDAVRMDKRDEKKIVAQAKKVLAIHNRRLREKSFSKLVFTDTEGILKRMKEHLKIIKEEKDAGFVRMPNILDMIAEPKKSEGTLLKTKKR